MNREIELLQKERDAIQRRIDNLVAECPHHNTRKTKVPNFNGPAFYEHCLDCGKSLRAHWPYRPELDGPVDES